MILQALTRHYEALSRLGKIAPPGWGTVKVSYVLYISDTGELERAVCVKNEQLRGKKTVLVPQEMTLPAPIKRSSGIAPNFLCDNSSYLLGIDAKGKPERSKECFQAARELHQQLLEHVDTPAAKALLAFFQSWKPEQAAAHPALQDYLEDMMAGANLVFRHQLSFVHDDPLIRQAWDHFNTKETDHENDVSQCLVTGKLAPAVAVHPSIKGVTGAQSSGAALISFNAPAFCSYGKEQNLNAPVSKYGAFAYTTALNHLLADRKHVSHMGDTTVVFWAESGEEVYQDLMGFFAFGQDAPYDADDLADLVQKLCQGKPVLFEETRLDTDMKFYILGLSPNAARLSVRFFLQNSFGSFLKNVMAHYERLQIVRPAYDKFDTLPLWKLLDETVNQNARNKAPLPNLAGETLRAILMNTPYPAQLLQGAQLRIRAESDVTRGRAAIIKAYYTKKPIGFHKEVLTVALNSDSTHAPYVLGRLFSVLEAIQNEALGKTNTTIKDRYFNAASASPAHVFPLLLNLAQKHLKKIKADPSKTFAYKDFTQKLEDMMGKLDESFPAHLSIPDQGAFQLGYYHQTQARYTQKNKEEN